MNGFFGISNSESESSESTGIDNAYKMLGIAVITQAVSDYIDARESFKNANVGSLKASIAADNMKSIERFFCGDEFKMYSDINGIGLFHKIKNMPKRRRCEIRARKKKEMKKGK